jgi:hypothetical protein
MLSLSCLSNSEVVKILEFVDVCRRECRDLTDVEFEEAARLNWKLTCPDRGHLANVHNRCPHLDKSGFDAVTEPCIECQTCAEPLEVS